METFLQAAQMTWHSEFGIFAWRMHVSESSQRKTQECLSSNLCLRTLTRSPLETTQKLVSMTYGRWEKLAIYVSKMTTSRQPKVWLSPKVVASSLVSIQLRFAYGTFWQKKKLGWSKIIGKKNWKLFHCQRLAHAWFLLAKMESLGNTFWPNLENFIIKH